MKSLFDYDGPLMDVLRKLSDIVIYNVLFVLTSIPIITMGASLTALCEGMQNLAEGKESDFGPWKDYWKCFKTSFFRSTKVWLVVLAGGFYLYALQHAVMSIIKDSGSGSGDSAYMITYYVCAFILTFGYMNLFPSVARWKELKTVAAIIRAFQISIISIQWTGIGIALTSGFIYITLIFNLNVLRFGLFLWIVCGFAIVTYIYSFFFLKGAYKYETALAEREKGVESGDTPIGGSIFVDTFNKVGEAGKEAERKREETRREEKEQKQ